MSSSIPLVSKIDFKDRLKIAAQNSVFKHNDHVKVKPPSSASLLTTQWVNYADQVNICRNQVNDKGQR